MRIYDTIFFFLLCELFAKEIQEDDDDDVEHQIYDHQALDSAKRMDRLEEPDLLGCTKCSWQDVYYCKNRYVLDDHCCCDRRHNERFPYIPHVCYKKLLPLCRPSASDCEEYKRLNVCCCQMVLRDEWAYYAMISSGETIKQKLLIIQLLLIVHLIRR